MNNFKNNVAAERILFDAGILSGFALYFVNSYKHNQIKYRCINAFHSIYSCIFVAKSVYALCFDQHRNVELTLFHFEAFVFYQLYKQKKRTFILTIQCGHINNHHTLRSKSIYSSNSSYKSQIQMNNQNN